MSIDQLGPEIRLLESEKVKLFVLRCLEHAPNYFWTIPSSSSGQNHPADENTEGGLVLHTKRVVDIANHLCEALYIRYIERDCVLAAAILHDLVKRGYPEDVGYTVT